MSVRLLLLSSIALFFATTALADCPMQTTHVSGTVTANGEPAAGILISVHWDEQRNRDVSSQTRSAADGSFQLALGIDSFDGRSLFGKEKCGYAPASVHVEAQGPEFADYSSTPSLKELAKPLRIELKAR